jgi:P4 family phage/plasmid primase-like protien
MLKDLISPEVAKSFIRPFAEWETLINDAKPADVFDLLQEAFIDPELKEFERTGLVKLGAKRMGTTARALNHDLRQSNGQAKKSHRDFARETCAAIEHLIYAQGMFWLWRDSGVWARVQDHEIRRTVADVLEGQADVTDGAVRSVLALVRDEAYSPDTAFDQPSPRQINLKNGTLRYTAGAWVLNEHCRADYLTTQLPVAFDPAATCPRFERFLSEVFEGDADAADKGQAILEMMGYTLLQSCQFEKFAILVGKGSNGKSVLLDVVRSLVGGEQVASVDPGRLNDRVERAHLHGKLANICPELAVGSMLADAQVKAFTSGDLVSAAAKFGQPFDYKPFATFWTGTNHMPHTRDLSHGMFRRALILQFNRQFDGAAREIGLADKLQAELPGILNRSVTALAGVIERGGFTLPASSEAALKAWRTDADQVAQFLEDRCKLEPGSGPVSHAELFRAFGEWCESQRIKHSVTGKVFTQRLEGLGLVADRHSIGGRQQRAFLGVEFV